MLTEYLEQYEEALRNKDAKRQKTIERELSKLGMDYHTLMVLVKERERQANSK